MIIEPDFAQRHDAGARGKRAQFADEMIVHFARGIRVHADRRENMRVLFRELDGAATASDRRADRHDAPHICRVRARKDGVQILRKIREIEMRVGIGELH